MEGYKSIYSGADIDQRLGKVKSINANPNTEATDILTKIEIGGTTYGVDRGYDLTFHNGSSYTAKTQIIKYADGTLEAKRDFPRGTHKLKNVVAVLLSSNDDYNIYSSGVLIIPKNRNAVIHSNIIYEETILTNQEITEENKYGISGDHITLVPICDCKISVYNS